MIVQPKRKHTGYDNNENISKNKKTKKNNKISPPVTQNNNNNRINYHHNNNTNINFQNRKINNNDDLDILNAINDLPPGSYPTYNPNSQNNNYDKDYIKIGTLNIRSGFNNKKSNILEYFITNNYDILAIQEMHITNPHLFTNMEKISVSNNEENINLYIYKDTNGDTITDSHSGVCIIMKEELQKRVSTVKTHKGRVLTIELHFKKIHLLIINTYIPANNQKKEQIETCYKQIETLINSHSSKPNAHIILLGDLNVQPCKQDRKINTWKARIYRILKMASMVNAIKQHHDRYLPTHAPAVTKEFTSAIDHIYTTQNLIDHSYYASTATIDPHLHFNTDHKCVFLIIHHDYIFKNPNYRKQNIHKNKNTTWKNIYNYHKMNDDLWLQYTEGTKNYLAFHRLEYADAVLNPLHTSTIQAIETKWTILKKSILAAKAQYIPMYNIKATNRNNTPLPIRQKENMILQIHHALLNFSIKKIIHRMAMDNEQSQSITIDSIPLEKWQAYWNIWPLIRKTLYKANNLFDKIIFNYLPLSITQSNYTQTKRSIKQGLSMAKEIKQAVIAKHDITNINFHILN
ncbi:hypothetical protein RclHR1_11640006 [Rhizophagus clarus]|uniref:Endonuclease/exonuclease/phosphatase domain-containing protein n=1 Tax=Rhizophagus clarus TaxID=94130 RepID=A0A2Z6QWM3_9GLOM|nr:hypothetical protein RclHR1_11640006 [Rhizophagus clarus]